MRIEHTGLIVRDLEEMKSFYVTSFNGVCSDLYINPLTRFSSYFISFENGGRLELMYYEENVVQDVEVHLSSYHHIAFAFETREQVDQLTANIRAMGCKIIKESKVTGLGDYVSTINDPEGNILELLVLSGG